MDEKQKAAVNESIEQGERIILIYKERERIDQSYELSATISALIDLLNAFVDNIEARKAAGLLSKATYLVNAIKDCEENCYATKEVAEATKLCKEARELVEKLKAQV